jgi:hypothetical protein
METAKNLAAIRKPARIRMCTSGNAREQRPSDITPGKKAPAHLYKTGRFYHGSAAKTPEFHIISECPAHGPGY